MYRNLADVVLTAIVLRIGHCSMFAVKRYSLEDNYLTSGNTSDYKATSESDIMCSVICTNHEDCATFMYNETSNICHMSEGVVATGLIFGPYIENGSCPENLDYRVYVRQKNVLCLKHYPTAMTFHTASSTCGSDGAHLVLSENESMFQLVLDIVIENGWGNDVWVDGYDEDDDGQYLTFKGDPLPYIPPNSQTYISPGFQCLRLETSEHRLNDNGCSLTYPILCQIDV